MRKQLLSLLKLALSLGLLLLLFHFFDFGESWAALRQMDVRYFLGAFLLFLLGIVLRAVRWRFLLDALAVSVPFHRLVYLYLAGAFFNAFLPSGFGGDAVKTYELARHSHRVSESLGTVLVDRLSGLIVLFVAGLLALPFVYRALPRQEVILLLAASTGGLVAVWVLFQQRLAKRLLRFIPKRFRGGLESLYQAIHTCGTQALWKALAVSVVFNMVLFLMNHLVALALDTSVPFLYFVAFMPAISLSMLLPSLGSLGTREGAYVLLFGTAGVPEPLAIAMSLTCYLINVLTGLIGGVLYAINALSDLRVARETKPR